MKKIGIILIIFGIIGAGLLYFYGAKQDQCNVPQLKAIDDNSGSYEMYDAMGPFCTAIIYQIGFPLAAVIFITGSIIFIRGRKKATSLPEKNLL